MDTAVNGRPEGGQGGPCGSVKCYVKIKLVPFTVF